MAKAKEAPKAQAETTEAAEVNLLDQIVEQGRFGKATAERDRGRDMVKQFVSEVLEGAITVSGDTDSL